MIQKTREGSQQLLYIIYYILFSDFNVKSVCVIFSTHSNYVHMYSNIFITANSYEVNL